MKVGTYASEITEGAFLLPPSFLAPEKDTRRRRRRRGERLGRKRKCETETIRFIPI